MSVVLSDMFSDDQVDLAKCTSRTYLCPNSSFADIAGDGHRDGDVFNGPIFVQHSQSGFPPSKFPRSRLYAAYNSQEHNSAPRCHPETRKEVLERGPTLVPEIQAFFDFTDVPGNQRSILMGQAVPGHSFSLDGSGTRYKQLFCGWRGRSRWGCRA